MIAYNEAIMQTHNGAMNQSYNHAMIQLINIKTGIYIMYLIKYKERLSIIRHNAIVFNKNIYDSFQNENGHINPR